MRVACCDPLMLRSNFRSWLALAFIGICSLLLTREPASAKLVAARNPLDGVLDAELVAIVRQAGPGEFAVERVFLGGAKTGDVIGLPGFKLSTPQADGPDIVEAITEDTRILMFLRHGAADSWELTGYTNCFFWVQDSGQSFQLQDKAERALDTRQRWEEATRIAEPGARVAALWEFVFGFKYGRTFFEHTMKELRKTGALAGDYIAEKFDSMSWNERSPFYNEAGAYGSELLHEKLINDLTRDREAWEAFVLRSGWNPKDVSSHWNGLPESAKDLYGEVYYGLAGIASFKARRDLPLIQTVGLWAVAYHLEQPSEVALRALKEMPDSANLPVIAAIEKEFPEIRGQ